MTVEPVTRYASLDDQRIAYQVVGEGPIDLLITNGYWGSIDVEWEDPMIRLFHERLAVFSRVIRFDRRGTGASDPLSLDALPPWEAFAEEIECVLDAAGSNDAALFAMSDAGPAAMLFAASRPERSTALVLFNSTARFLAADDYPIGLSSEQYETLLGPTLGEAWGTEGLAGVQLFLPSRATDPRFVRWAAKLQRTISSPEAVQRYAAASIQADGRSLLSSVQVPTLVLQRASSPVLSADHGRYLADHITGARLVELPGQDSMPYWEYPEETLTAVEELLTGKQPGALPRRALASILFTDIVDSTKQAEAIGDRDWHSLLNLHDETAGRVVEGYGGRIVKSTGDGILAIFDGPGRAIRAGRDLRDELHRVGLQIRTGIHTGEIEFREDDLAGIAVHVAARVMATAAPQEIMVTSTVRDLVTGSGIGFIDRGRRSLKGVDGEWQLYALQA
ncbi:MAG: alpha/beta fold hydrolase [Acidimicrobiia bacterium]